MKILHIISSADPKFGGPLEGVLRQHLATTGIGEREIVTCDLPDAPFLKDLPIAYHALGSRRPPPILKRLLQHYHYTPHLIPWLRANISNYDAIIVNGLWNYATLAAAVTLPGGRTPYFVFTHGMMDPWFKQTYPLKHIAKIFFWLCAEGRLLSGATRVLFTTAEERELARDQFPLWQYKEEVVGYGTAEPPEETPQQKSAFHSAVPTLGDRPYLLFLSRIHRKKGCDLLVEAFAKVAADAPELQLVIAGPDQDQLAIRLAELGKRYGVQHRIHWPGMLTGDAKWGAFRGAEAFVLPSHQENFGIVVAEALACGTPVLISDKVNIWREVLEAGAGIVGPDDTVGTESLLRSWLALPLDKRLAMKVAARQTFEAKFDAARIAPALLEMIGRLVCKTH